MLCSRLTRYIGRDWRDETKIWRLVSILARSWLERHREWSRRSKGNSKHYTEWFHGGRAKNEHVDLLSGNHNRIERTKSRYYALVSLVYEMYDIIEDYGHPTSFLLWVFQYRMFSFQSVWSRGLEHNKEDGHNLIF